MRERTTFLRRRSSGRRARFGSDRRGATAIEFAMISVPLLGLIGALFETGFYYFKLSQLQLTTESASRTVLTRSAISGQTYQDFIEQNVCSWKKTGAVSPGTLSTMFDCDQVTLQIQDVVGGWNTFNANDFWTTPPARTATIDMPPAGHVAVVRIAYPASPMATIITGGVFSGQAVSRNRSGLTTGSSNTSLNGKYLMMGVFAFRVEP